MHPQTGKRGNIDALDARMISVTDNPNPVDRRQPDLPVGARNSTTRGTGTSTTAPRCRTSPARTTSRSASTTPAAITRTRPTPIPATPYSYNFANGVPTAIAYRIVRGRSKVNVDRDLGLFAQDKWTTGPLDAGGRDPLRQLQEQLPRAVARRHVLRPQPERAVPEIDNLNWNDITPKLGATYDVFGNGQDGAEGDAQQVPEGLGTTGVRRRPGHRCAKSDQPAVRHHVNSTRTVGRRRRQLRARLQPEQL